jgi:cytochrome P450
VYQKGWCTIASLEAASCPFAPNQDERKSAAIAARNVKPDPNTQLVQSFGFARQLLRSPKAKQAGAGAELVDVGNPEHVPVFYLDGEMHKLRRAAITKLFSPHAVQTRYRTIMERTTDKLLSQLRATGSAQLDEISFELAVTVAAEIVGLTNSEPRHMAPRIIAVLRSSINTEGGWKLWLNRLKLLYAGFQFYAKDVRPAVKQRRAQRGDDIISQTLDKGYSDRAIMIECMTYATAGMVTTREFIVMVAWYMFERPALREQFLTSDEDGQLAILQEILRLEPVASMIMRRVTEDMAESAGGTVRSGTAFSIDLRAVNSDENAVGECPHMFDAERAKKMNQNGKFMSFGDGAHHCPGWQVALHETRVFVDRLLRVPGITLERAPDMHWNHMVMGYELRDAIVTCDKV